MACTASSRKTSMWKSRIQIQGVLNEEAADFVAPLTIEIDRLAPRSVIAIGEVGSKIGEIIAFGTQMVVDDIERDAEIFVVTGVDQPLQSEGAAVGILHRKRENAVVSPISLARKL